MSTPQAIMQQDDCGAGSVDSAAFPSFAGFPHHLNDCAADDVVPASWSQLENQTAIA